MRLTCESQAPSAHGRGRRSKNVELLNVALGGRNKDPNLGGLEKLASACRLTVQLPLTATAATPPAQGCLNVNALIG